VPAFAFACLLLARLKGGAPIVAGVCRWLTFRVFIGLGVGLLFQQFAARVVVLGCGFSCARAWLFEDFDGFIDCQARMLRVFIGLGVTTRASFD